MAVLWTGARLGTFINFVWLGASVNSYLCLPILQVSELCLKFFEATYSPKQHVNFESVCFNLSNSATPLLLYELFVKQSWQNKDLKQCYMILINIHLINHYLPEPKIGIFYFHSSYQKASNGFTHDTYCGLCRPFSFMAKQKPPGLSFKHVGRFL